MMTSFRFLAAEADMPFAIANIYECVDRVGSGNGSDFFYNWSEKSCDVDNLSQSILKGLACDKVETELEMMSFFPELSCACY